MRFVGPLVVSAIVSFIAAFVLADHGGTLVTIFWIATIVFAMVVSLAAAYLTRNAFTAVAVFVASGLAFLAGSYPPYLFELRGLTTEDYGNGETRGTTVLLIGVVYLGVMTAFVGVVLGLIALAGRAAAEWFSQRNLSNSASR